MNRIVYGFGPHLMLDLYGCDKDKLNNITFIYELLDTLPVKIGMCKIAPPQVISYQGKESSFDKGGISAFVLIAESHISIHTFIKQEHAFVDIFSCKEFHIERAEKLLIVALGAKKVDRWLTDRGVEFPKEVPLAAEIVKHERKGIR